MKNTPVYTKAFSAFISITAILAYLSTAVLAAVPEPKSGGKWFRGKGTRYEYSYQGRYAGPLYDYGKGIQIGEAFLKPFIEYRHEWDNNIFFEENGKKTDNIDRLSGGATLELPLDAGQHVVYLSYLGNVEWFGRFSEEDHTDHTIGGGIKINLLPISLWVDEKFRRTSERADTEFTQRVERDENTVQALLEVPFASFFLETELDDYDIDYDGSDNEEFDRHDFTIFQRVGIDVAPSTQGLVEVGYTDIDYSNVDDRNGDASEANLGVRGYVLSENLTYEVWAGAMWRAYDESPRPDFNDFIFRGGLVYDLTEESYLNLKGSRRPVESTFGGQTFYTRNRVQFNWRQQIAERIFFNTREYADYNEYGNSSVVGGDSETRRDWVWQAAAGLEYFMPNEILSFFGEYKFNGRESNTALLDYDGSSISIGARGRF